MAKERSCYECQHKNLCSLHRSVERDIRRHLDFIDVDQQSHSPTCFVRIHATVAIVCTKYKETT